jgi:H+-translocating NAD(P) transhydrogenase subunit alpha
VPSILHTPLMSGSNAIHGIVLVGALFIMGEAHGPAQIVLGFIAVFLATLNVVGGFVVTDRMLEMFRAKPDQRSGGATAAPAASPASPAASPASPAASPASPAADPEPVGQEGTGGGDAPAPSGPEATA